MEDNHRSLNAEDIIDYNNMLKFKELDFSQAHIKHINITEYSKYIYIESLVIEDKYRGKRLGTKVLKSIINYAQMKRKPLYGYASKELGGDLKRLREWYKRLGFDDEEGELDCGFRYNIKIE